MDAAFFGGIPKNQVGAPVVPPIDEIGVDSISVSLHKLPGTPYVNGAVLSKERPMGKFIEYIEQKDTTVSGCRQFQIFSTYQRIKELFERSNPLEYLNSIKFFEDLLRQNGIKYEHEAKSNIFVFKRPSEEICNKYQLCPFVNKKGEKLAHIIIFPEQDKRKLTDFVRLLKFDLSFKRDRTLEKADLQLEKLKMD